MDLAAVIHQCTPQNVSVQTMGKVLAVENTALVPHTIGYKIIRSSDGKEFLLTKKPKDKPEAVEWANWFIKNGYEFDAGAAQVHSTNFASFGLTVESAFEACPSIRVGAKILTGCYERALRKFKDEQVAVRAAVSCYQSNNFKTGFRNGYVEKVVRAKF